MNTPSSTIGLRELILFLPMKEETRKTALGKLGTLNPDQKLQMSKALWASFFTLFQNTVWVRFQRALTEARTGKRKLHNKFYQEIEQEVHEEFAQKLQKILEGSEIANVRSELQKIMQNKAVLVGSATHSQK